MYTDRNFKTKKALKEAVKSYNEFAANPDMWIMKNARPSTFAAGTPTPRPVTVYQPGPFGTGPITDGSVCIEGPHAPEPHKWYASGNVKDGILVKVS